MSSFTSNQSIPSLKTVLTKEALNQLLEPVRDSVQREERLWSLYIGPAWTHCSLTPYSIPTTRGNPSMSMGLYTPTCSRLLSPTATEFIPKQYERESSIESTDSQFDPNNHFHNPLLDPRYLVFLLRLVYQRARDPAPNFASCIIVPLERLIYILWFENPSPVVHLEESTVRCTRTEFSIQPTTYPEDHQGCILGFTPAVTDLFPNGQGDIFSMFFLKEDMCYPWLWSLGL